jgi:hypothetical protein
VHHLLHPALHEALALHLVRGDDALDRDDEPIPDGHLLGGGDGPDQGHSEDQGDHGLSVPEPGT